MADERKPHSEESGPTTAILALVLWPTHLAVSTWLSFELFGLAGGIQSNGLLTQYGGIDVAWTNLAWLPGGILLSIGSGFEALGFLLLVAGSGIAASAAAVAFTGLASGTRPRFGRWAWRLWVPVALWFGWMPVSAVATLTYWTTVAY